ncbi:hypothetical protein AGABI2DRAFT_150254 [Agaricus bisporus var. bisporus H97]|uniref:hypothetical protein n=1 Tax=Agaricus bisporus var. bisporus (strain H97 / ATCC MYA-4626 / FGSC 10389) TaxID=936046 RepID=UPI00029F5E73|nr:hypothetical protein AGABI2DRAFT_150254 [Agaricus bisporus var. bisporus H97]EKV48423.1 hypothetical protein AGABI2DRAFT_150254 [Agaricus bisporus var. bisporus H97]
MSPEGDIPLPATTNDEERGSLECEAVSTTESAERIEQPPAEEEASILGTLARLGLLAMTEYNGQSIFSLAYVQALGCLIMGFALRLREPIGQFYGPFYTALTTGFCGSLTTFSSWQTDIFDSWINNENNRRSGFHSFIDGLGKSVFTLSFSLASVSFGYNMANLIAPYLPTFKFPRKAVRYSWTVLAVCMYAAVFPAYFQTSERIRCAATAALLFAFPGALTRYLLGIWLNQRSRALPLGTLFANLFGTALLGGLHVLQGLPNAVSPNACCILQGLGDGYCACLTTVSTFAAEMRDLKWWKAVRYCIISWGAGQLLLVLIVGSSMWAGGVAKEATCSYHGS